MSKNNIENCPMCGIERSAEGVNMLLNVGWECPRCKRIYSPFAQECTVCNEKVSGKENE